MADALSLDRPTGASAGTPSEPRAVDGNGRAGRADSTADRARLFRRPLFPTGARDGALLQSQIKSLVAIRLVVVTSVFLLYFLLSLLPEGTSGVLAPRVIFLLLGLAYGFSLV